MEKDYNAARCAAGKGSAVGAARIKGGYSLSAEREYPPFNPPRERTRGLPPRPRTLAVSILKSCSACGIGCGVHGFAMNPCISLLLSTAPYYREARVTFAWRRTACGMWHCCARRIDKTGGRRELLRTSTRWAERHPQGVYRIRKAAKPPTAAQQRIIGAETSRIAKSLAASVSDAATQAVDSASVAALRAAGLQWRGQGAGPLAFSWGSKGDILSRERISPFFRTPHGTGYPFTL